jgi:hypothetical protein
MIIEYIGVQLTLEIFIRCDKVGRRYLSNNYSVGLQTYQHNVGQYNEDKILMVIFNRYDDNDVDIITKNTREETCMQMSSGSR